MLDASVAVAWELNESTSAKALALRELAELGVHELLAPDIFPVECAHALTRAERRGLLSTGQAGIILAHILYIDMQFSPSISLIARATEISSRMKLGVYDCLYVVLAMDEQSPLVTSDQKLIIKFPDIAINIMAL
ncbi:MAG: type II toxin-antitoxin system VapC family toxin [Planctomycetaceae bacterium]|nr:type II toxin-antitoxin system VapC family toxin [Planctomycetaceae bacterium]